MEGRHIATILGYVAPRSLACLGALLSLWTSPALAGGEEEGFVSRLGGHVGLAVPLVSVADGDAVPFWDEFVIAIPMGVTVKRALGPLAFDMEIVPAVSDDSDVSLTIHPGLIYGGRYGAVGMRAAFDVEGDSVGFTPLLVRPFTIGESLQLFVELDVPVRFPKGPVDSVVSVATHVGIAF